MILASNVLYLLSNFKEAVKQLRSKVVHSNPLDINSLEKIVPGHLWHMGQENAGLLY